MADDAPSVYDRFKALCGDDGSDDVSAVQALAEEVGVEAVINARDKFERDSCLHAASRRNRVKTARQLIAWRADVDSRNEYYDHTPLFYAKSSEMVRVLVKEGGAKVNVIDKDGFSPLSDTTYYTEVTEALLEEGALVMFGRYSPLERAALHGYVEAMKVLLAHRGFVRVIEWKDEFCNRTARETTAVFYGDHVNEMVAMLEEASVLAKVWDRRVSMARVGLAAADARVEKGVKRRLVHATDVIETMSVDTPSVYDRFTALCGLRGSDDVSAVQALAEEVGVEAVINARGGHFKESCLHYASTYDRVKTARQLVAWRADVDSRDTFDQTPLFFAKSAEMMRLLVKEGGAKVNVIRRDGVSPLSVTTAKPEMTEALLEEGALVMFGRLSPLAFTALCGHVEAMKVLLAHRGFVRVIQWKDGTNKTAREEAVYQGHHEIVTMLDEALVLAKVWERRLPVARVGLAAVDARVARPSSMRRRAKKKS